MQKKLTVLFAFAIFVLVVGWTITPVQAHCMGDVHTGDHVHRTKDVPNQNEGNDKGSTYNVTVLGPDVPLKDTSMPFTGNDGGGRSKPVNNVIFQFIDLDLSFFSDPIESTGNDPIDPTGNCFAGAPVIFTSMTISQEKDGSPIVQYWFTGFGNDVTGTKVDYLLEMFGGTEDINGKWRPTMDSPLTVVDLRSWEMSINGKLEIACIGEGNFTGGQENPGQTIEVELKE